MLTACGRPVAACTWVGAASDKARKMLGAMYQPTRVRRLTLAGLVQFRMEPSGACTVNGR